LGSLFQPALAIAQHQFRVAISSCASAMPFRFLMAIPTLVPFDNAYIVLHQSNLSTH
jgi:hypothetical protein